MCIQLCCVTHFQRKGHCFSSKFFCLPLTSLQLLFRLQTNKSIKVGIKATHVEEVPSNKTKALTKIMNTEI